MTSNQALADELEAVNSIYDANTVVITTDNASSTAITLTLPDSPFSFSISFPVTYPDLPPRVDGTQSTGPDTRKGQGNAALEVLRDVLGRVFVPGQVCLFDLIEEVTPMLQSKSEDTLQCDLEPNNSSPNHSESAEAATSEPTVVPSSQLLNLHIGALTSDLAAATSIPPPNWILSESLVVSKSTFIARALSVENLPEATSSISHLLSTNKKVATATHNITAWRIKSRLSREAPEITVQDCDDDGETAAGGRLLHLMQLMDVWNVVVVVTRWYGGVKLGPDRFRCINMVARESLVKGGFTGADGDQQNPSKGKGKKK